MKTFLSLFSIVCIAVLAVAVTSVQNVHSSDRVATIKPYAAPEIISEGEWFNSDPIKLADLKGQVVLVEFWTFSCYNCINTRPHVNKWYESYKDSGFEIIGVHAPEFAHEKKALNVQKAIEKYGIQYPVVMDNNFKTWRAYKNRYWPAFYVVNKQGDVVHTHFGEGKYQETENIIKALLAE